MSTILITSSPGLIAASVDNRTYKISGASVSIKYMDYYSATFFINLIAYYILTDELRLL